MSFELFICNLPSPVVVVGLLLRQVICGELAATKIPSEEGGATYRSVYTDRYDESALKMGSITSRAIT